MVPWYRLVGVVSKLQKPPNRRTEVRAALSVTTRGQVDTTWYGGDSPHLALPISMELSIPVLVGCAQGEQARLAKTVKVQALGGGSPWIRPSAPGCGDTSKAPAAQKKSRSGARTDFLVLGVAIDWVTGRSHFTKMEAARCTVRPA